MTLNLTESHAVNRLIDFLTVGHDHEGRHLDRDNAVASLAVLADGAYKRLGAGINGDRARSLLNEHWHPETAPQSAPLAAVAADVDQADPDANPRFAVGDLVWTALTMPAVVARLAHSCSNRECPCDVTLYFEDGGVFCYTSATLRRPDSPYAEHLLERQGIRELIDRVRREQEAESAVIEGQEHEDDGETYPPGIVFDEDEQTLVGLDGPQPPFVRATPAEVAEAYASSAGPVRALAAAPSFERTDYCRYLPGVDGAGRAAIWCIDCDPTHDPIWTDAEAVEQVVPISIANYIAICDEHERQRHGVYDIPPCEFVRAAMRIDPRPGDERLLARYEAAADDEAANAETISADKLPRTCSECGRGLGPSDGSMCGDCELDADQADPDRRTEGAPAGTEAELSERLGALTGEGLARRIWQPMALANNYGAMIHEADGIVADVKHLLQRLTYRAGEAEQLAETCHQLRGRNDVMSAERLVFKTRAEKADQRIAALEAERDGLRQQIADDIQRLKGEFRHPDAMLALGHAIDVIRGTQLTLRTDADGMEG